MILTRIPILLFVLVSFMLCVEVPEASWLIDGTKYHVSVHGQNSCQDCHENIVGQGLHPNPSDVNKNLKDFFRVDTCLACHDEVMYNLDEGVHGSKKVEDVQEYSYCIRCHQPHYQLRLGEDRMGRFDPSRPLHEQCGACHETRTSLPPPSDEDRPCLACHRLIDPEDPKGKENIEGLCFHCHAEMGTSAQEMTWKMIPLINSLEYRSVPHAGVACTVCHPQATSFNHGAQKPGDCGQCHLPHDEKVAHDAHMLVVCEACHLRDTKPLRDPESKLVLWKGVRKPGEISRIHQMVRMDDEAQCRKCHFSGNQLGAVSMILPAKSILCMPCHASTFSVGDTTTIIALIVFLAGLVMTLSVWLTGSMPGDIVNPFYKGIKLLGNAIGTIFSSKIVLVIRAMILDVLLQRRLYRQSGTRWIIHSLIFLPFVFRFSWGLMALVASLWKPEWTSVWIMLEKNHPTTAFLFDLTGIMVILGVVLALTRRFLTRPTQVSGLPGQDYLALGLIAGIIVIGFILEGMRITMTGSPGGAQYAFAGYGISLLFSDPTGLTDAYGYIWYIHAILTGAFVAYLPFSQLFHIIMAPVVLAMSAVSENEHIKGP